MSTLILGKIMDIVCRKYSCTYNKNMKCERKHLGINSSANCADIAIESIQTED